MEKYSPHSFSSNKVLNHSYLPTFDAAVGAATVVDTVVAIVATVVAAVATVVDVAVSTVDVAATVIAAPVDSGADESI